MIFIVSGSHQAERTFMLTNVEAVRYSQALKRTARNLVTINVSDEPWSFWNLKDPSTFWVLSYAEKKMADVIFLTGMLWKLFSLILVSDLNLLFRNIFPYFPLFQCVCNTHSSVWLSSRVLFSLLYNNLIINVLVRIFWLKGIKSMLKWIKENKVCVSKNIYICMYVCVYIYIYIYP